MDIFPFKKACDLQQEPIDQVSVYGVYINAKKVH